MHIQPTNFSPSLVEVATYFHPTNLEFEGRRRTKKLSLPIVRSQLQSLDFYASTVTGGLTFTFKFIIKNKIKQFEKGK